MDPYENDQAEAGEYVSSAIVDLATKNDLYGTAQRPFHLIRILAKYFEGRVFLPWPKSTKMKLRPLILKNAYVLEKELIRAIYPAKDVLVLKSSLVFICEDFPEVAESLLYSPLMESMNAHIDTWVAADHQFSEIVTIYEGLLAYERWRGLTNHSWWDVLSTVGRKIEIPAELHELETELENRRNYEMSQSRIKAHKNGKNCGAVHNYPEM